MRILRAAIMLASTLAAAAAAQEGTWVGKTVFVKRQDVKIGPADANATQTPLATLDEAAYRVLAERNGRIQVRTARGVTGWLDKAEVVPLEDAVAYFTARIKARPKEAQSYSLRGAARELTGDLDGAIKDQSEALRRDPTDETYYNRGRLWGMKKQYDKAIADFDEAIRICEKIGQLKVPVGTRVLLAALGAKKQDVDASLADLKKTAIDPKCSRYHAMRGATVWDAKKDRDKALADLDAAIRLDPQSAGAYYLRGTVLNDNHEPDRAIVDCTEAIRLDPGLLEAYLERGKAWHDKKDYARALADYRVIGEREPNNAAYLERMAWLLATADDARVRDGKRAVTLATEAWALDKSDAYVMDTLAAAYAEAGNFQQASYWQEQALKDRRLAAQEDARQRLELYRRHQSWRQE